MAWPMRFMITSQATPAVRCREGSADPAAVLPAARSNSRRLARGASPSTPRLAVSESLAMAGAWRRFESETGADCSMTATCTAHGLTVATGTWTRMLRNTGASRQPPRTPPCTYGDAGVTRSASTYNYHDPPAPGCACMRVVAGRRLIALVPM